MHAFVCYDSEAASYHCSTQAAVAQNRQSAFESTDTAQDTVSHPAAGVHTFAESTTIRDTQSKLQVASGVAPLYSAAWQTPGVPSQIKMEKAMPHKHQCTQLLCALKARAT